MSIKARIFANRVLVSYLSNIKMPPQRTPLGSISRNRIRGHKLSPYTRAFIMGMKIAGKTPTQIALTVKTPARSIWTTIAQDAIRIDGKSRYRAGRPKCYTDRDERRLLRYVRLFPKHTYTQVGRELNLTFGKSTIKRILKEYSITN